MSSQQLITDMGTVISNGPNSATQQDSIAAAGPINDYVGNCKQVQLMLYEARNLATLLIQSTDPTDSTNLNLLTGITGSLV